MTHRLSWLRVLLVAGLCLGLAGSSLAQVSSTMIQRVRPTDGTRELSTLFDADSGAGTQWLEGVVVRMSASGGSVEVFRAEDSGHTSGDPGLMIFCVRNDAATVLAGTTLDYIPCTTNASGQTAPTGTEAGSPINGRWFSAAVPVSACRFGNLFLLPFGACNTSAC